jgi:hypothetical protein
MEVSDRGVGPRAAILESISSEYGQVVASLFLRDESNPPEYVTENFNDGFG